METDTLIARVKHYLRETDVLVGDPVFARTTTELKCVDPRGEWDEYYMQPPFWQDVPVEFHQSKFDSIDSQLSRLDFDSLQERALREIPDSGNTVIIDLGSEYGDRGSGYLAAHKPNAQVILVSKPWEEAVLRNYLFVPHKRLRHVLRFTKGQEILREPDLVKRVNSLYKTNGIHNVMFYLHELTIDDTSNLPHFFQGLEGKDIYFFSHYSPRVLPFLMGKLYNKLNAKYMCVSLTAQEKVKPDMFSWKIVQKNLGLTDEELRGYIESAHDPEATERKCSLSDKYDYKDKAQERIGVMIKLGIALALAKEVDGKVFRDGNPEYRYGYNRIDHYVEARR